MIRESDKRIILEGFRSGLRGHRVNTGILKAFLLEKSQAACSLGFAS